MAKVKVSISMDKGQSSVKIYLRRWCETKFWILEWKQAIILALVAGLGISALGCDGSGKISATEIQQDVTKTQGNSNDSDLSNQNFPPGTVLITCGVGKPTEIKTFLKQAFSEKFNECTDTKQHTSIYYDGSIDDGFAKLIEQLNETVPARNEFQWANNFTLIINSLGGEVGEAVRAGKELSKNDWTVNIGRWFEVDSADVQGIVDAVIREHEREDFVEPVCYSACVLFYAAASHRDVKTDHLGIHRLFPGASNATSIDQLGAQLVQPAYEVEKYLEINGVSRALVDEMMAVPSRKIRVLTDDERKRFGLGADNAAKDDLRRISMIKQCGRKYVDRREFFFSERDQCFDRSFESYGKIADAEIDSRLRSCILSAADSYDLPDESCADEELRTVIGRVVR